MTLNQIKYRLEGFFNNHAQIKQTVYADAFDFSADRNLSYPVCNIEYLNSQINGKQNNHIFKVVLADLYDPNIIGQNDEIQSDLSQVAEDLFTFLQYTEGWDFNKSVNVQKFTDSEDDRTSGLVFQISLGVIRPQNLCAIPVNNVVDYDFIYQPPYYRFPTTPVETDPIWEAEKGDYYKKEEINSSLVIKETVVTNANPFSYTIQQGYFLQTVIVKPLSDSIVGISSLGNTGSGDIIYPEFVTSVDGAAWVLNMIAISNKTILFEGFPDGSKLYIIKSQFI